jgi:hypothetical protein
VVGERSEIMGRRAHCPVMALVGHFECHARTHGEFAMGNRTTVNILTLDRTRVSGNTPDDCVC